MTWTPHYTEEPHAFAQDLAGALPFTPHEPNQGPLRGTGVTGLVTLEFQPVLTPSPDACLVESIKHVWLYGRNLTAARVTAPEGWTVMDALALEAWPGTSVLLVSPPEHRDLSVTINLLAPARRAVALTEWRGEPNDIVIQVDDDNGGHT